MLGDRLHGFPLVENVEFHQAPDPSVEGEEDKLVSLARQLNATAFLFARDAQTAELRNVSVHGGLGINE
jgi:hypothetical protein